jgi:hypothetical protein
VWWSEGVVRRSLTSQVERWYTRTVAPVWILDDDDDDDDNDNDDNDD